MSQIFDYGNTALEKRAILSKRLLPLLNFEREREGVDLSQIVLTHHNLRNAGQRILPLRSGESVPLQPMQEAGFGSVQEKVKTLLREIIGRVNDLFGSDTPDGDKLVYVKIVSKGKLSESQTLTQRAMNKNKEQFASSPDLSGEILTAIVDAFAANSSLSKQALNSEKIREGLRDILLGSGQLYDRFAVSSL